MEENKKIEKQKQEFNYLKIKEIDTEDPVLIEFIEQTLIPSLLRWAYLDKYKNSLVKFIHSLGVSVSFVLALAENFHDVSNAMQIAIEAAEQKILLTTKNYYTALPLIEYYRRLFRSYDTNNRIGLEKEYNFFEKEPVNFNNHLNPLIVRLCSKS
ncbi:MAG: hypothetical protein PHN88_15575 [Ignavibacteria bacterium]|nr:hypothetical protein [Ignavibacteria bacterium]